MDQDYDPLSHLSTALSLLPRTLAGVGYSLPVGSSEVDQIKAFFSHMHGVLKKDQKSGKESLEKQPSPSPNIIEKEEYETGKSHFERQQQAFMEPMMKQQHSTRSYNSKLSPNPVTIDRDETARSFEGKLQDVKSEPSEPMQLEEQPYTNSYARKSPHSDSLHIINCETRNASQGQNWEYELMELQPKPSSSSLGNKLSSKSNEIAVEKDETGKDSAQGNNGDANFYSLNATMMEPQNSIIGNAIENISFDGKHREGATPILESTNTEKEKTENISFDGQHQYGFESVEFMEKVQRSTITIDVNNRSSNPDSMVLEKEKPGNINLERESNLNSRSVASMLESRPSIHSQVIDKTEIERGISEKNGFHPVQMVENERICRRPGLGLDYNISPFTLIQKNEKAKQVVSIDFTILDCISDPDAFTKKVYELEAAVAEITRLGGEPKIIGERVFKMKEDDQPMRRRPGLRIQMPPPEFVLLPMHPLPAKLESACACYNQTPTESTNSHEMTKAKTLSGSQNEAPSSISSATQEVPEMNLYASSSSQRLLSVLESWSGDEEKAVAMIYDCLNLRRSVIPEMPKFSRLDVVKSPWRQLPSVERVRDLRGEDSLDVFEELKKRFFTKGSAAYCSDDDTNSLVGIGSIRSLSTSPGCQFSFENEDIEIPYHAGPSGSPIIEIEELLSQEKIPEMTSEARGGNISDDDINDDGIPDEPELGSPWDNSPVNIEVALSPMRLENSPVNTEEVVRKEASSRKGKKRRLEHADSSPNEHSKFVTPTSDSNTGAIAETSLVEPPRERDEQVVPPKKKIRKQQKGKSSIQILEGGLQDMGGVRRSTRIRSRPLRGWMGERLLYARIGNNLPTAVGVKECSPATVGMRVKVKSFVSEEHADLVARLAK